MNHPPKQAVHDCLHPAEKIREMFGDVVSRYDMLNTALSLGMDALWRNALVKQVLSTRPKNILDAASGTGEVALHLLKKAPLETSVLALDFCQPMLSAFLKKISHAQPTRHQNLSIVLGDAMRLPCKNSSFDAITVAFGLRNFPDRAMFFAEARRALKSGGHLHILEFSQPPTWAAPFYFFYLKNFLPRAAEIVSSNGSAYRYLADSIAAFPNKKELSCEMEKAGFKAVSFSSFSAGAVALHGARNP